MELPPRLICRGTFDILMAVIMVLMLGLNDVNKNNNVTPSHRSEIKDTPKTRRCCGSDDESFINK